MKQFTIKNLKADKAHRDYIKYVRTLNKDGREPLTACIQGGCVDYALWLMWHGYVERSDEARAVACQDPGCAYLYARRIDEGPYTDTREAACKSLVFAYFYAVHVDRVPRKDTREMKAIIELPDAQLWK